MIGLIDLSFKNDAPGKFLVPLVIFCARKDRYSLRIMPILNDDVVIMCPSDLIGCYNLGTNGVIFCHLVTGEPVSDYYCINWLNLIVSYYHGFGVQELCMYKVCSVGTIGRPFGPLWHFFPLLLLYFFCLSSCLIGLYMISFPDPAYRIYPVPLLEREREIIEIYNAYTRRKRKTTLFRPLFLVLLWVWYLGEITSPDK